MYISWRSVLMCRLPEDGGVPPKHVAVNKNCIVKYIGSAFVGFYKMNFVCIPLCFCNILCISLVSEGESYMSSVQCR
jgi:hypothetical protein